MVESRLRGFGHVQREPIEAQVRKVDQMAYSPIIGDSERSRNTTGNTV